MSTFFADVIDAEVINGQVVPTFDTFGDFPDPSTVPGQFAFDGSTAPKALYVSDGTTWNSSQGGALPGVSVLPNAAAAVVGTSSRFLPDGHQHPGRVKHDTVVAMLAGGAPNASVAASDLGGFHANGDNGGGKFYWDGNSTESQIAGYVIQPTGVDTGRWKRPLTGKYNAKWHGAVGDGFSHPLSDYYASLGEAQSVYPFATSLTNEIDWCAIQSAVNTAKLAVTGPSHLAKGGTVHLPKGVFICDQPINADDAIGISLSGCGGHGQVGTGNTNNSASVLVYTGADSRRFLSVRSTNGVTVERLAGIFSSPSYSGNFADASHSDSGSDTENLTIRGCMFSGGLLVNPGTGARCLLSLANAISSLVDDNEFGIAQSAIRLREADHSTIGYCNRIAITNNNFVYHKYSVVNADESIIVRGNSFEGTAGVNQHAYYDDFARTTAVPACTITFNAAAKTVTRSSGSFITDGWLQGMAPVVFEQVGLNTGTLGVISPGGVTSTVLTLASAAGMVDEVKTSDCKLYAASLTTGGTSPTTDATLGITLTFAGSTITRNNGSWITDGMQVGQPLKIRGTASNSGETGAVTSLTATVLSMAADTLTFDAAGKTITRSSGSWITDGFAVSMVPTVQGSTSNNSVLSAITTLTDTVMTMSGATLVNEASTACEVYVLVDAALGAFAQASPGHTFAGETATSGTVYLEAVAGPMEFSGNWCGDQFLPSEWLQFNQTMGALDISNNQFIGNRRAVLFNGEVGGLVIGGNHFSTTQEPVYAKNNINGATIVGNQASGVLAGDLIAWSAGLAVRNLTMGGNTPPTTATGPIDKVFIETSAFSQIGDYEMLPVVSATGFGNMGLRITQNAGTQIGIGTNATQAFVQSNGGDLCLNWFGRNTRINAFGFGRAVVGYPYHGAADPPVSLFQVNGAIATTVRVLPTNADTVLDEFDSTFEVDASAGDAAGVMPDPATCQGREYIGIAYDVSGGTASAKTAAGLIKSVGFSATTWPFASQWQAVKFKSDGTNWVVVAKV